MEKKQTAVEWLEEIYLTTGIDRNVHFNQAKAMHKDEIISFGYQCTGAMESELGDIIYNKLPEDIYNETFEI